MEFQIREAREEEEILRLIKALAKYEKMLKEVTCTSDYLKQFGFGDSPRFSTILVEDKKDSKLFGFALYFFAFSTFTGHPSLYLEDLFIEPEYRRHGAGKALLSQLAKIAQENQCQRMEWACLDWNEPSIQFYYSIGAQMMKAWRTFRLTGTHLEQLARWQSNS